MNNFWQYWPFITSFYAFGILGFFGITLLPLRSWLLLSRNSNLLSASTFSKVSYTLIVLSAVLAIWFYGILLYKIANCLLGFHCSANRSGGWFFLAEIGFIYMAFEAFSFTLFMIVRKVLRISV